MNLSYTYLSFQKIRTVLSCYLKPLNTFSLMSSLDFLFTYLQVFKPYICELSKDPHGSLLQFKSPKHQIFLTSSRAILFSVKPLKKNLQLVEQGVQT